MQNNIYQQNIKNKIIELESEREKELKSISSLDTKIYLETNAKIKLSHHLILEMYKIEQQLQEYIDFVEKQLLRGGNPPLAIKEKISLTDLKILRKQLTKTQYHFPDVLKIGEYISLQQIPSKIFPNNKFVTKSPFFLPIRDAGVAFLINPKYKNRINELMEIVGLKLIASVPDGLAEVTIMDKAGAGQNFPTLSKLHSKIIEGKIVSDDYEIERMMQELKNNMKSIIQNISMNGFESVEDYNKNTDEVPQRYNFVFISGFPAGFNKSAIENLTALIEEGYKAGMYIIMSIDYDPVHGLRQSLSGGITLERLLKNMVVFEFSERPHEFINKKLIKENVELIKFPLKCEQKVKQATNVAYKLKFEDFYKDYYEEILKDINARIEHISLRPVIPITKVVPSKEEWWSKTAGPGICVPFGKKGIDNVFLSVGIDEYGEPSATHHGLIGGKTGSGKTVFIHDVILMASIYYPLDELEFWLLDYKEGTEFALYSDFPHVTILSMESEIEFGIDVLKKAIDEIARRGEFFKKEGVSNLTGYNKRMEEQGRFKDKLPRIILFIDEFQVLLSRDSKTTEIVNNLLDDIVRRGRSFGVNLFLATQTLKDITFKDSIRSNMPLRVALAMEKKDAAIILSPENTVAEFIQNPGEGILNKAAGIPQYNIHFQAYLALDISEKEQYFSKVKNEIIDYAYIHYSDINSHMKKRFVYNGEVDVFIEENEIFMNALKENRPFKDKRIYLGVPAGLNKEHINIKFNNDFAENMILVGPDIKRATSTFYLMVKQIEFNYSNVNINLVNSNAVVEQFFKALQSDKTTYIHNRDSIKWLNEMETLLKERMQKIENQELDYNNLTPVFNFLFFIESSKIFASGGYSPEAKKILNLIQNGPEYGIHMIIYTSDFSALSENGLNAELSKFRKKIAFYDSGETSLKIFGPQPPLRFDKPKPGKEPKVAIVATGDYNQPYAKYKPYKVNEIYKLFK